MIWKDGSIFEGKWANGIQHGFGKMSFPDGSFKQGMFLNNVFQNQPQLYENNTAGQEQQLKRPKTEQS